MKAIVYQHYGSPEELELKEVSKPVPKNDEVLIKVHAVSLNGSDCEFLSGTPLYTRMWGLFKPRYQVLGSDIAGTVEEVGAKVTRFQSGDAVFGDIMGRWGGLAEYVVALEKDLTLKPDKLTFEQVAAIPQAALVALQGLRDKAHVEPGQKVLINGAGGGSGTFAVQIAQYLGAEVTGVDCAEKLDIMRSIGAQYVIDYVQEDFTKSDRQYDVILDFVASHSIFDYHRVLTPKGRYIMVGGSMAHLFQTLLLGTLVSITGTKKMGILGAKPNKDMADILEMIASGKVVPVIDKQYVLSEAPEALRYLGAGQAKGKVVIQLVEPTGTM